MADADTSKKEEGNGADVIRSLLTSKGPVVKCVVLRHMSASGKDLKPHTASPTSDEKHRRRVIPELVDEIDLDTTPSKKGVEGVLGRPFEFIGQYVDEGTIIIAHEAIPDVEELKEMSAGELKLLCIRHSIDMSTLLEKSEMVAALVDAQLPVNPHMLQPPFDEREIRGDILLMRVAETDEGLDEEIQDEEEEEEDGADGENTADAADGKDENVDGNAVADAKEEKSEDEQTEKVTDTSDQPTDSKEAENGENEDEEANDEEFKGDQVESDEEDDEEEELDLTALILQAVSVQSNEEFFLNYTKEEWIAFASRTDVVAPKIYYSDSDDEGDGDFVAVNEDDDDEVYVPEEEDEEEARRIMLHSILSEHIRLFREEKGRGPDSDELIELRAKLGKELGVDVPTLEEIKTPTSTKKRPSSKDGEANGGGGSSKKVKFDPEFIADIAEDAVDMQANDATDESNENGVEGESSS